MVKFYCTVTNPNSKYFNLSGVGEFRTSAPWNVMFYPDKENPVYRVCLTQEEVSKGDKYPR